MTSYAKRLYLFDLANNTNRFKIGKTISNPYDRLDKLKTGSPYALELYGAIETDDIDGKEVELHQQYDQYRVQGEWFQLPPQKIEEVLRLFKHENLEQLKGQTQKRNPEKRTKEKQPYQVECWSSRSHPHPWEQCWKQETVHFITAQSAKTGWVEDHRSCWQTPEGVISGHGWYVYCCIVLREGELVYHDRLIGGYEFELSSTDSPAFNPLDFAPSRTRTKLKRIIEKITAGESYMQALKYLGSTYLWKLTDYQD